MNDTTSYFDKERLSLLLEGTRAGYWEARFDTGDTFYSPGWRQLLGYTEEDILPSDFWKTAFHPEDFPNVMKASELHFEGNTPYFECEARMRKKTGEWVWVLHRGKAQERDEKGNPVQITGIMLDITDLKETNRKLQESDANFRAITENSLAGIYILQDDRLVYVNPAAKSMIGYSNEDIAHTNVSLNEVIYPDDQAMALNYVQRRLAGENVTSRYNIRLLHKDGHIVYVEIMARKIVWLGKPAVLGSLIDISERFESEEERNRLATAIEQSSEEVMITDVKGLIQYVNPAFEWVTGYTRAEVLGKNPRLLQSGRHDKYYYKQMWKELTQGRVWRGQFINRRKDGVLYEEKATISPVRDGGGKIVNFIAVKRDVTREKSLEVQLNQSQKMEAIGRLAGGVAHDFNNILTVINGNAEMISEKLHKRDPMQESLSLILEMVGRGTSLTRQLLAFSKRQPQLPEVVNINSVVSAMTKMLRRLVSEDIEIEYNLSADIPNVVIDTGQLEQVLMNLVVNSRDAIPSGGKIIVETAYIDCTEEMWDEGSKLPVGKYCMLAVVDTGTGMTDQIKQRIFDPFYTTKPVGKGTGLGLSTAHGIVMQSGGYMKVETEAGFGTTMKVYLPAVDEKVQIKTKARKEENLGGTETILLVEDESAIRLMTEQILRLHGYNILTAGNGKEAELVIEKQGMALNLILTDVVMPYLGGPALIKKVREKYPEMKVLFMSGYTNESSDETLTERIVPFLPKPFGSKELLLAVRAALQPR